MSKKPITSIQAQVKKSMECLYDSCRRGRIHDIPKLHKKFSKAKEELDLRFIDKEDTNGKEER